MHTTNNFLSSRRLTAGLFAVYFLTLTWLILAKGLPDLSLLPSGQRSLNLIPFAQPLETNGRANWGEVWQNLLAFLPFGLYRGLLAPNRPMLRQIAPCFLTSLAFESLQFLFGIGASDITDLISNTVGGLLGLALCVLLRRLLKEQALPLLNLAALACTLLILLFIALLLAANF